MADHTTHVPMKATGELVPRFLLRASVALVLVSLIMVSYARLTDKPLSGVPADGPIAAERMIGLTGTRDGAVTIRTDDGKVIAQLPEHEAGFISVIWRGLDRKRQVHGVDPAQPVRLVRFADGRIAVIDPATGWRTDLRAFGRANQAAFASLVDQGKV